MHPLETPSQMTDVKGCYWQLRMPHLLAISLPLSVPPYVLTRAKQPLLLQPL